MSRQCLKIELTRVEESALVHVTGSINMNSAEDLRRELEKLAVEKAPRIVLDMTGVDFICSAGLGAIISAHLKCRHHKGRVLLVNPQPAVRQILETTRLTKLFPVYDNVDAAVGAEF